MRKSLELEIREEPRNGNDKREQDLLDWHDMELLDVSNFGEIVEVDEKMDPPAEAPVLGLESRSFENLSKLPVREHESRAEEDLRAGVCEVLKENGRES